jgi:hypothetical protein
MRMNAESVASAALPALVENYLRRALRDGAEEVRTVRVTQTGEMWLKPAAKSRPFTAVQDYTVRDVAFSWRARFPVAPLVALHVVDRYAAGEEALVARLFGLPVMRQVGPETAVGEALRYLAELAWVPQAITGNALLEWRDIDEHTVEVSTNVGPVRAAVALDFDADGDIVATRCERPYPKRNTFVPRPWVGSFRDYAVLGGVRVPTRGEVRWELPEGPFTYWRGTITSLHCDPLPARRDIAG